MSKPSGLSAAIAKIDREMEKLAGMRAYLVKELPQPRTTKKPKAKPSSVENAMMAGTTPVDR